MRITPIDIQQMGFRVRIRGYDRKEVDAFLETLTEEYQALIEENNTLKERLAALEIQLQEYKKKEAALSSTLMKAHDFSEEMKVHAQKEEELIIKEAELKAEEITRMAREKLAEFHREMMDLQSQKVIFIEKARSLIRTFQKILDLEEKDGAAGEGGTQGERDDNLSFLKPK